MDLEICFVTKLLVYLLYFLDLNGTWERVRPPDLVPALINIVLLHAKAREGGQVEVTRAPQRYWVPQVSYLELNRGAELMWCAIESVVRDQADPSDIIRDNVTD